MKVLNGIKKDPDNYLGCVNSHAFSRLVFTDIVSIVWKSILIFAKYKLPMFFLKYEDVPNRHNFPRNYIYFLNNQHPISAPYQSSLSPFLY